MTGSLTSFIPVEPDSHFSIQNLPFGVYRPRGGAPRVGTAIGDLVLDLAALERQGILRLDGLDRAVFNQASLNSFMELGSRAWRSVRAQLTQLLSEDEPALRDNRALREEVLSPMADVELMLPVEIGDYTDFYSSRYHATNVGTMIRGAENALQENWNHLPVAYHGRSSSVIVSGENVKRPMGQLGAGKFGPSRAVDFELEAGCFIGTGSALGEPVPIERSFDHMFGMVLVNDWSARDIQKWEYVPLGPFLSKNFATSISPWVVTFEALAPFALPIIDQQPSPLPYLNWSEDRSYDIQLEVDLQVDGQSPQTITQSNFSHLHWSLAQQLAHHTVTGCNMRTGDLLASGTISGPEAESRGCMLELTWRGEQPIVLPGGQQRAFLQDNDRITMRGWCQGEGYRVGFGEVTGELLPNHLETRCVSEETV